MGIAERVGERACDACGRPSAGVADRGWIPLGAFCDPCWRALADELAADDGLPGETVRDLDPDDLTWYEPPPCPDCGDAVRRHPTNYDRWVDLAGVDLPARAVPPRYRWRLVDVRPRDSAVVVRRVAVRVRGVSDPEEPVAPAHRAVCLDPEAVREVERERGRG